MTHDTGHIGDGEYVSKSQAQSSNGLEVLITLRLFSDKGVCSTAPATPGLLILLSLELRQKHRKNCEKLP